LRPIAGALSLGGVVPLVTQPYRTRPKAPKSRDGAIADSRSRKWHVLPDSAGGHPVRSSLARPPGVAIGRRLGPGSSYARMDVTQVCNAVDYNAVDFNAVGFDAVDAGTHDTQSPVG